MINSLKLHYRLFDVTPELQQVFPKFKDVPRDQLESNNAYRSHTLNVVKTVDVGVKTMNDIPTLSKTLQQSGFRNRGFGNFTYVIVTVYFTAFESVIVSRNTRRPCYVSKRAYSCRVREF